MRTRWLALVLACDLLPRAATGQEASTITGAVTSIGGTPLSSAQVYVPGTPIGGLTNEQGRYLLLDVPVGPAVVRVELVGYRTEELVVTVSAGETTTADFQLAWSAIALDEIVVTGTGKAFQRKQLGNTIATVDASELEDAPVSNFSELLQAREPSVVGLTSDGAAGSGTRIRIRGSNSLSMSNEPVVYVDGIRVDNAGDMESDGRGGEAGSRLDDINWESVERVELLKGAAAATLYGSEASSGVIQIFTKTGRPGDARFNVRLEAGTSTYPDVITPNAGFATDEDHAAHLSEMFRETLEPFQVFERDFTGDMLERGSSQAISADVTGGSDQVRYFLAGRYSAEDGPLGAQELGGARDKVRRIHANTSLTFLPRESLTLRLTGSFTDAAVETFNRNNNTTTSPITFTMVSKPDRAHCAGSSLDTTRMFGSSTPVCTGPGNPWGAWGGGTPREAMQFEWVDHSRHLTGTVGLTWAATPGISVDALVGMDQVDHRSTWLWPFDWRVDGIAWGPPDEGSRSILNRSHRELTLDTKLAWSARPGSDFSSDFVAGLQTFTSDTWFTGPIWGGVFPGPGIEVIQAGQFTSGADDFSSKVSLGTYLQEQVGYRDWIFATLGARFDKTSAFGSEAGSAFYPKASLSAIVSELPAWSVSWLPTFRLRAAYGQSGLQPGAFDKLTTYAPVRTPDGAGVDPENIGNANLKPERATEIELGAEAETLSGRLGLDVTYWDRTTLDALVLRPFPAAGGFLNSQLDNIGQVDAHGWELQLTVLAVDVSDATLSLFANGAYLSEVITSMGGAPLTRISGGYQRYRNALAEGYAPGSLFGARLLPVCGPGIERVCYTPGTSVPYDSNGDGVPDSVSEFQAFLTSMDGVSLSHPGMAPLMDDEDGDGDPLDHYLGKTTPDWQGSLGGTLTLWGRLTINTLFEYRAGNYAVSNLTDAFRNSMFRNTRASAAVEATLLDPSTRTDADARLDAATRWATEYRSISPYSGMNLVEAGDFVRWRELSVAYRLPAAWSQAIGLDDVTLGATGRNLVIWTGYSGTDPEVNAVSRCGGGGEANLWCNFIDAVDAFGLPLQRRFTFNVRFGF
jgi:TonB-linked SusC/RagA family outer membrane protein